MIKKSFVNHSMKQTFLARYGYELAQVFLLVAITAFAYSNTIQNGFVFDDNDVILQNHLKWTELNFENLANVWQKSLHKTRPVANISFALNYYFHQYDVAGYHLVNIVIHIITGVFLFLLVKATITLPALRSRGYSSRWLPFLTALLWLLHPLQTQSVTYTVQRMNSMAGMFYLISLFTYVRGRLVQQRLPRVAWFGGCAAAGLLALGSKEIALTLPFFIILYEWYFLQDLSRVWLKKYCLPGGVALFVMVLAAGFFYYGENPFRGLSAVYALRDFTIVERLLTESRVVLFYISLLVYPHLDRLNVDHDFVLSQSLLAPLNTVFSLGALSLIFGGAVFLARQHRLLSFCIIWFFGNLVIESSIVPLEIIFEHRLYLPAMMGVLLLVGCLFEYVRDPPIILVISVMLVLALAFGTYQRNKVWRDQVDLWGDVVSKSPEKARGHGNLGIYLLRKGEINAAEFHSRKSLKLDPTIPSTHNNLGNIMVERKMFASAMMYYSKALSIEPDNVTAHVGLGNALLGVGRLYEGREHYRKAIELHPGLASAIGNLSLVNKRIGALQRERGEHAVSN